MGEQLLARYLRRPTDLSKTLSHTHCCVLYLQSLKPIALDQIFPVDTPSLPILRSTLTRRPVSRSLASRWPFA